MTGHEGRRGARRRRRRVDGGGERGEGRWERGEGREGRWMKGMISENLNSVQERE